MDLTIYKHKEYQLKPNKNKLPINNFSFDQLKEFNDIYQYARANFMKVKPTRSRGICNKISERLHERYFMSVGNQRFELVIICLEGCYRFILQNPKQKGNEVSGRKAAAQIYKWADEFGIDFSVFASNSGIEEKKQIESPHIKVMRDIYLNKSYMHVYHMDFKSSYASRICEAYPQLRPMYEVIYKMRKEDNDFYKHVLTNSIGCWQSEYCLDYETRRKSNPYQFAKLSRIAINGTRAKIEDKLYSLKLRGFVPLLTNTDGIWYYSNHGPYHDKDEGTELGQWENDHLDCKFLMTGPGSYQYVENGKCHTVLRGLCDLDATEPDREKWNFGDILKIGSMLTYKFDEERGVYKTNT